MGIATQKMAGGRVIGFDCGFGHTHPNRTEAESCKPEAWAAKERERLEGIEKARIQAIRNDERFDGAVEYLEKEFDVKDSDVAEGVVFKSGIDLIFKIKGFKAGIAHVAREVAKKKKDEAEAKAKEEAEGKAATSAK